MEGQRIAAAKTSSVETVGDAVKQVLKGNVVLLADGMQKGMAASLGGGKQRSVQEPVSEAVIRGPREGFIEDVRTNTTMLRRKLHSPRLKMESLTLGEWTQTTVVIAYVEGIVNESLVTEVRERVSRVKIDGVLESGYLEEMIEDTPFSPFPQAAIHGAARCGDRQSA